MMKDGTILLSRTYCSARDRNIPVLVREAGVASELVSCLDYGVRCTGWLCPLFSVPAPPSEELLEAAIQVELQRKRRTVPDGRGVLARAVREGRERRAEEARRAAARRERAARDHSPDPPRIA